MIFPFKLRHLGKFNIDSHASERKIAPLCFLRGQLKCKALYIHVCIHTLHTFMHTYITYMHAYMYEYIHYIHLCIHTLHTCMHTYITYIYAYIHYIPVCINVCIHICMHAYMYAYIHLSIDTHHAHMCIVYEYMCTDTH